MSTAMTACLAAITVGGTVLVLALGWALCRISADADERAEQIRRKH